MTGLRRRLAVTVVVLAALVVVVWVADAQRRLVDLTEDETLTLSSQTRDVVASLDRDVTITFFARRSEPGRVEAVSLLDRYRRLDRRIEVDVRDPDEAPGEARRLGVDPTLGGVAVTSGGRTEVVPFANEGNLTGALARLLRDEVQTLCLTTGHGERAVDDASGRGLVRMVALLERDGHRVDVVDLLADDVVPVDCAVMVVAAPTGAFSAAAERSVARWVDADGRLLLLTDPVADVDVLGDLLDELGLRVERGVVLEGDAENVIGGDVSAPIVTRYPSANPVGLRLPPTFFPVVQEIAVDAGASDGGLTVSAVAVTSETSYLERNPVEPSFDPDEDRGGPLTVVAAADRSQVEGVDVRRTRVVVTGDVDFATDDFIAEAGNAQLLRQAVAWLTETEDLVAISPNLPRDRPLRLTDARADYARVVSVGVVPGLFLVAGAMVWAVRRGR